MVELSVIIPTYNRAKYLEDALVSVLGQSLNHTLYEIIVVNNGSSNDPRDMVEKLNQEYGQRIRYFSEPSLGLHNGRHRGARESCGNILVYVDDDIIALPEWLEAIRLAFCQPEVMLVGGKNLPEWEGEVPAWINFFWTRDKYDLSNGYLSLLDFGDERKEIPPTFVYGCNFSIRKPIMYECGGFHPDGMPQELIQFRGDGETGLAVEVMKRGYKAVYEPKATIYHRIPAKRLSLQYFCKRFFNQGISDSYTEIRKTGKLNKIKKRRWARLSSRLILNRATRKVQQAYEDGYRYHQEQVKSDPKLLAYVLKNVYY